MTRKKEIDPDRILDAAEAVIVEFGGRSFTLDAVAERAGISKGGLVYTFATKDELICAALARETARFRSAVEERLASPALGPLDVVLAHIEAALDSDDASARTAAFLVTALVHAPDMMEPARAYYRKLLKPLLAKQSEPQGALGALLAVEGIFLLRGLGLAEVTAREFRSVLIHARDTVAALNVPRHPS